jgi:hypothetical protein
MTLLNLLLKALLPSRMKTTKNVRMQNTGAQFMRNEGSLVEVLESVTNGGDDIDVSSGNGSSTDAGDGADDAGEISDLPSILNIARLRMDSDEDKWLTYNSLFLYIFCCVFEN